MGLADERTEGGSRTAKRNSSSKGRWTNPVSEQAITYWSRPIGSNNFNNKMKRKQQPQQVGIRVKNLQAKRHQSQQSCQDSTFLSEPFSFTFDSSGPPKNENVHIISQSLGIDLICQIQRLNSQMTAIGEKIKQKDTKILQLESKLKALEQSKRRAEREMKNLLEEKTNEIKRKDEQIERKNIEIEGYKAQLNSYIEDIKTQNRQMISQFVRQLDAHRQRQYREVTQLSYEHQRSLKLLEQNSLLQKQIEQNSILQKLDQNTVFHRQQEQCKQASRLHIIGASPQINLDRQPSAKRTRIQRAMPSAENFKPLGELIKMNSTKDLHESVRMLSPLTVNIDHLEHRQKSKPRARYIRTEELENGSFYR